MENKSESNKDDDTKSYDTQNTMTRRSCPFHGFERMYEIDTKNCIGKDVMEDRGGNQCGFATIINMPDGSYCLMKEPKLVNCSLNTLENKLKLLGCQKKIKVYPKEFQPRGTSLKNWIEYVENRLY